MPNSSNEELLLAQWQTYVEMADSTTKQRNTINNIFITINLGVLAMAGRTQKYLSIPLIIAGIAICVLWIILIRHYKQLIKIKFEIIEELEEKLPGCPYISENKRLARLKHHKSSTDLETILPSVIIVLYITLFVLIFK